MPDLGDEKNSDKIDEFVKQYAGGTGGRSIRRVLVANNGLAAMKCLISIRMWLQMQFDTNTVVSFVCIATEHEMKAASQYLKLADEIILAPSGKNTQNFANVDVIVRLALESSVNAVYVGWGHASENPELVRRLKEHKITFIGPSTTSIIASGDKIVSTIIAQSIGMPTVAWSGADVKVDECVKDGMDFHVLREKVTIKSVEKGLEAIKKYGIGVPLMIKASEGGGGKGIRKCDKIEHFPRLFKEVELEVPNSPIFLMKCMEGARHVEIQIVGDQSGEVIALSSRDCTIQRRCQKVIEEAPATIVPGEILEKMEKDAINFAKFVGYYSAGTVELLFVPSTNQYFFLELNPRLQVEHPCTEAVCDVNVPALQFQIAMGVPLARIPDIQRFKKAKEAGELPKIHSMAARVTCEDPNDRFLPSTGSVKSLKFGSTSKAWAYFSLSDGSTVHEFADSQIGHVFARGRDRPEAIANLKHALHNLKIDATFPTQSDYLIDLLSLDTFKQNTYDTQWLDKKIANRDGQSFQKLTISIDHLIAVSAAAIGSSKIRRSFEKYENSLKSGKIVLPVELSRSTDLELQLKNVKYSLKISEESPSKYHVRCGTQETTVEMLRIGTAGSQKIAVHQGKSTEYQLEESDDFWLVKIAGNKLKFSKTDNDDASVLRSPYTGKFLEYKVAPGEFLQVGDTYAQVESMKMVFDVVVKVAPGRLIPVAKEGDLISPGTVLGRLEIDKQVKDRLTTSEKFTGTMQGWRIEQKTWFEKAKLILEARGFMDYPIDELVEKLFEEEEKPQILELLEQFLETERHFDPRDGFDESVQQIQKDIRDSEDIVNRIHSNTHLKRKETLIAAILERLEALERFDDELEEILQKMFRMRQLKTIWPLSGRILYRSLFKTAFDPEDVPILTKEADASGAGVGVASMSVKMEVPEDSISVSGISDEIQKAIVAIANFGIRRPKMKFVANRIELWVCKERDRNTSLVEEAIQEMTEELGEAEIKEVVLINYASPTTGHIRFLNEIGEFIQQDSQKTSDLQKPEKRDLKRSQARQNRTSYIYDFPLLFARIASEEAVGSAESHSSWRSYVEIQELIIENEQISVISDPLELEKRAASGANACSVVAWILKLKLEDVTREFVLIGNDITHQVGSFAMPEHRLFELASKLARQRRIPRINVSCNSGARIGLARDVLEALKVKLKPNGHDFDYLYVDRAEKERIGAQIVYEECGDELKLLAVKGRQNEYIGVENLMGSGAIGGETSRAYREIPTYCYVTGRSVGIGAYTARLARRIIQHDKSHLILTGAVALNTLLGKKVYASNNRLGGIEIMENNGIAHATVPSDLEGVRKLVEWLGFLPVKQQEFPFFRCFEQEEEDSEGEKLEDVQVTRDEMQKDVRNVIAGYCGKQGIFDTDSFDEICFSWAASIVTGRAKLNGLPVGVIASQWKSFEKRQLADESVEISEETQTAKAGQVWYPDSAFKTSQAISDFNRESLPLVMIASLRGFSGGRKDMSDQVLTFGAHIIDELSQYTQPVIVYIPAGGELRGGAWAVVDSNVNRGFIHVIADSTSRGGILEANAVVGIKIRDAQLQKIMKNSGWPTSTPSSSPSSASESPDSVKSAFKKAAVEFADMHDRWQRMEHVGAIRQVTELQNTRNVFWRVLRKEMIRIEMARRVQHAPIYPKMTLPEAVEWVNERSSPEDGDLQKYYINGFWSDVRKEVEESKRKFEEAVVTWQDVIINQ